MTGTGSGSGVLYLEREVIVSPSLVVSSDIGTASRVYEYGKTQALQNGLSGVDLFLKQVRDQKHRSQKPGVNRGKGRSDS